MQKAWQHGSTEGAGYARDVHDKRSHLCRQRDTDKLTEVKKQESSLTEHTYQHTTLAYLVPCVCHQEICEKLSWVHQSVADIVERQASCPADKPTCQPTGIKSMPVQGYTDRPHEHTIVLALIIASARTCWSSQASLCWLSNLTAQNQPKKISLVMWFPEATPCSFPD